MWINNIGYVHQKVYLIDDTIKNNIAFDGKKINEEKLKYAVKLAQLDKLDNFIKKRKENARKLVMSFEDPHQVLLKTIRTL